jgi:hypothetical protein
VQIHQTQVRLTTVAAWVVWALGLVGVGLGFFFGAGIGNLGIAVCLVGTGLATYAFFSDLERREKRAFELGREIERASANQDDVRRLR